MRRFFLMMLGLILSALLAACGGADVTDSTPRLSRIEVTPASPTLAKGTNVAMKATAIYTDARSEDVTALAVWVTSDPAKVVLAGSSATGVGSGSAEVTASYNGKSGKQSLSVTGARLVSLSVLAIPPSPVGTTRQMTAIGLFSDQTTQDLTKQVEWSSSNPGAVSIGSDGIAIFRTSGAAKITAKSTALLSLSGTDPIAQGSTTVNASSATLRKIQLFQSDFRVAQTIAKGSRTPYTAIGIYSDNTTATLTGLGVWTSSDSTKAYVDSGGAKGIVTGLDAGSATITFSYGSLSASLPLTVTAPTLTRLQINFSSTNPSGRIIGTGTTEQFNAVAIFSDGTFQDVTNYAIWDSSASSKALVSNAAGSIGLVKAVAGGSTTISAQYRLDGGSVQTATFPLSVTSSPVQRIEVVESNMSTPYTPPAPVAVTQTTVSFRAIVTYNDNVVQDITNNVFWESSASSVAPISNAAGSRGQVRTLSTGTTDVTARFGGVSGTRKLTVRDISNLQEIQVIPIKPSLPAYMFQACRATGLVKTGTKVETVDLTANAVWESSNTSVALASSGPRRGNLLTRADGDTTITARLNGTTEFGSQDLTVTTATLTGISLTQAGGSFGEAAAMLMGSNLSYSATGTYDDGSTQTITTSVMWDSSDPSSLIVANNGSLKGIALALADSGTPSLRAYLTNEAGGSKVSSDPVPVALKAISDLASFTVAPAGITSIPADTYQVYSATGIFDDGLKQLLSTTATWSSSDESVATVSNARGAKGLAHAYHPSDTVTSDTTITAVLFMDNSTSDSATLRVKPTSVTLVSIDVTPINPLPPVGMPVSFTATGTYSDTSTFDLTALAIWHSSDQSVIQVSNGIGSSGSAKVLSSGTAEVTAQYYGPPGN